MKFKCGNYVKVIKSPLASTNSFVGRKGRIVAIGYGQYLVEIPNFKKGITGLDRLNFSEVCENYEVSKTPNRKFFFSFELELTPITHIVEGAWVEIMRSSVLVGRHAKVVQLLDKDHLIVEVDETCYTLKRDYVRLCKN